MTHASTMPARPRAPERVRSLASCPSDPRWRNGAGTAASAAPAWPPSRCSTAGTRARRPRPPARRSWCWCTGTRRATPCGPTCCGIWPRASTCSPSTGRAAARPNARRGLRAQCVSCPTGCLLPALLQEITAYCLSTRTQAEEAELWLVDALEQWRDAMQVGAGRLEPCCGAGLAHAHDLSTPPQMTQLDRFVLCGHSMGCIISLAYAERHPERVEHLLLASPAAMTPPPEHRPRSRKPIFRLLKWLWERDVTPMVRVAVLRSRRRRSRPAHARTHTNTPHRSASPAGWGPWAVAFWHGRSSAACPG